MSVSGVVSADVALPDKAIVTFDKNKTDTAKLIAAVKKAGYGAAIRADKDKKPEKEQK